MRRTTLYILLMLGALGILAQTNPGKPAGRRATPVVNAATRTAHVNDAAGDSARALEARRARSVHYHDDNGNTFMVDTVTGQQWVDSTLIPPPPPMKYPLYNGIEAGINMWDAVMRIFGQKYGLAGITLAVPLHNRYIPTLETGLGSIRRIPDNQPYTYRTDAAPYFKIGADYNFFYNSDNRYRLIAGVRYGFSTFRYSIKSARVNNGYWDQSQTFDIPPVPVTAGWFEIGLGLQVNIAGNLSAGWRVCYHNILHRSHPAAGDAWYIPGYGMTTSSTGMSLGLTWTFPTAHPTPARP